jgi:trans-2,3-dihydro-3-hydroxyanthranilate isomerase
LSRSRLATSISTADLPYTLLDVFTDVRLAGNGLAVVHDADGLDEQTMLAFAIETRLAETTFVQTATADGADYRNRIFSMAGEMPFAGHPSLGTAVAVARARGVSGAARYVQQTEVGLQPIDVQAGDESWFASMLQEPAVFGRELEPAPLLHAVGLSAADADPSLPPQVVSTGLQHVILPVVAGALERVAPQPTVVDLALADADAYGIYVVVCEPSRGMAQARMFGRSAQEVEDPATGSAAGPLCAYLHARSGVTSLEIRQGVEMGRPSTLRTELAGDRVRVSGDVVVVVDGTVRL